MSFLAPLQRLFTLPSVKGDPLDEDDAPYQWNQHARIVLAILIVLVSAGIVAWIIS